MFIYKFAIRRAEGSSNCCCCFCCCFILISLIVVVVLVVVVVALLHQFVVYCFLELRRRRHQSVGSLQWKLLELGLIARFFIVALNGLMNCLIDCLGEVLSCLVPYPE